MADMTPEQAIEKLRTLDPDKQRAVLSQLSPEMRQSIRDRLMSPDSVRAFKDLQSKMSGDDKDWYSKQGPVTRAASSFNAGFGIPESAQRHPSEMATGVKMAVLHPSLEVESLKNMYLGMTQAQQQLIDRAYNLQHMGDPYTLEGLKNRANGFVLGLYSAIPLVGPAIVNAVDQWNSGDKAGGIGSFTAIASQLFAPKLAGKASVAEMGTGPEGVGTPARIGKPQSPKGPIPVRARRLMQQLTASGPETTTEPLIDRYKAGTEDAIKKQEDANANTAAANQAITDKSFRQAGENTAKHNKAVAQQEADYQAQVAKQDADYQQSVKEANDFNQQQSDAAARKAHLEQELDLDARTLKGSLTNLESEVYEEGNRRFNAVRQKVGNPQAAPDDLIASVKSAEKNTLQGIPENVKEFRRILGMEGADEEFVQLRQNVMKDLGLQGDFDSLSPEKKALVDGIAKDAGKNWGIDLAENEALTWDKLQSLKTRLDTRLRNSRGMNPNLKQALFDVRDSVVDEMGKMAQSGGATAEWADARNFWKGYKEDFHTPTGPSSSGSPVAQALDAVDYANIRKPFTGQVQSSIGNRGVGILRKYAQFDNGMSADLVERILANQQEHGTLNPKAAKPVPQQPAPIPRPVPVEAPATVEANYKTPPQVEKPAVPTAEDITAAKQRKLRETAVSWGKLHTYDLGILANSVLGAIFMQRWEPLLLDPAFVAVRKSFGATLSRPAVRRWIGKPLPEEMAALEKLPDGPLKEGAQQSIRQFIQEEEAKGNKVAVNPQVVNFIRGQAKVQAGASGAAADRKTPARQIKDLKSIVNRKTSNPALPVGTE